MSILFISIIILILLTIILIIVLINNKANIKTITCNTKHNGTINLKSDLDDFHIEKQTFSIYTRGENKNIANHFSGTASNHSLWESIEYGYYSKDKSKLCTFNIAKTTINNMPNLTIQNKSCNHIIGDIFGYREVEYKNRDDLNDFVFRSRNSVQAFTIFNENFLEYLKTLKGNIEIENDEIIYYENKDESNTQDIIEKLDIIVNLLKKNK